MTDEELAAWVERTRARRGLSPKITDEATLSRIVTLAFAGQGGGPEVEGDDGRVRKRSGPSRQEGPPRVTDTATAAILPDGGDGR